jgi:hypothetical protein
LEDNVLDEQQQECYSLSNSFSTGVLAAGVGVSGVVELQAEPFSQAAFQAASKEKKRSTSTSPPPFSITQEGSY